MLLAGANPKNLHSYYGGLHRRIGPERTVKGKHSMKLGSGMTICALQWRFSRENVLLAIFYYFHLGFCPIN